MTKSATRIEGPPRLVIVGILGALLGAFIAGQWNPLPLGPRSRITPAPYRVAKVPGGTALRLAMVHDVLHERYYRHGPAWYAKRNDDARKVMAQESPSAAAPPSAEYLAAMDDLAVGLESLRQYTEGISVMRQKLALLPPGPGQPSSQPGGISHQDDADDAGQDELRRIRSAEHLSALELHRYSAYANLGTILVHGAMQKAIAGDSAAQAQVREGLEFIRRSTDLNPGAHFGRERWQAIAVEHLLECMEHRDVLLDYDMIGDVLDEPEASGSFRAYRYARIRHRQIGQDMSDEERLSIRKGIERVGMNPKWVEIVHPDYGRPMPFDEPTLAIIGMWTLGGGANPHFSLALGNIMEAIGQNELAWNAYERTIGMKDKFWPDPATGEAMVSLCRKRQGVIASRESANDPHGWEGGMRNRHQRELAFGLGEQKAWQEFEQTQISAGVALNDPQFYAAFYKNHPSIASAAGLADDMIVTTKEGRSASDLLPCAMLGAGMAMGFALIRRERKFSAPMDRRLKS